MPTEPLRFVVDELARGAARPIPQRRFPPGALAILSAPDLTSLRVLCERAAGNRHAIAASVNDATGERYVIIRELVRDGENDDGWRRYSGCEGQARVIPGKPDPFVSFYAYAGDGHFFAAGEVQSASTVPARVRLRWDDGYALEDAIENGVVLLFGARDVLEPAMAEFFDSAGKMIGAHATLVDER
jgi:hypothetical protein